MLAVVSVAVTTFLIIRQTPLFTESLGSYLAYSDQIPPLSIIEGFSGGKYETSQR